MPGFTSMEPIQHANSKNFASTIIKFQLCYGFCHTIVLNMDSKFYGVCCEELDLLHINCNVLLGDPHNPMKVEHVNCYHTIGLKIMTIKDDSVCVALDAILLLLYKWNSCPIPGTDIYHSLVVIGCEFTAVGTNIFPSVWNHILETSPHTFLHITRSHTYLSRNTMLAIVSLSTHDVQILAHISLVTFFCPLCHSI
jgi:hypothetical protein